MLFLSFFVCFSIFCLVIWKITVLYLLMMKNLNFILQLSWCFCETKFLRPELSLLVILVCVFEKTSFQTYKLNFAHMLFITFSLFWGWYGHLKIYCYFLNNQTSTLIDIIRIEYFSWVVALFVLCSIILCMFWCFVGLNI